jgi:hypothetical protein
MTDQPEQTPVAVPSTLNEQAEALNEAARKFQAAKAALEEANTKMAEAHEELVNCVQQFEDVAPIVVGCVLIAQPSGEQQGLRFTVLPGLRVI